MPTFPNNFTQDILDSLDEGVFTVDKNFRISSFNHAAEKITGYNRDEVIGKYCKSVFVTERCISECPIANVLQMGESIQGIENIIQSKNGKDVPIKINAAIFKNGDTQPIGGVISFRDMSYLTKIENCIQKQAQFHGIIGQSKEMREIYSLIREMPQLSPVY